MTAYRARLTESDIRRLIKSDLEDERAAAAHKLCRSIDRMTLDDVEREAAQKILSVLAADAAELVRAKTGRINGSSRGRHHRVCRRRGAPVHPISPRPSPPSDRPAGRSANCV